MNKALLSTAMLVLALDAGAKGAPLLTNDFRDVSRHGRWIVSRSDAGGVCALSTTTSAGEHARGGVVVSAMSGHDVLLVSFDLPAYKVRAGDRLTSNAYMGYTHFLSNAHATSGGHIMEADYMPNGIGSASVPFGQGFLDGLASSEGNVVGMRFDFLNLTNTSDDSGVTETEIDPALKGVRQAVFDFRACVQKAGISLPP